ncbi:MAG: SH3 domain-containing protein [Clostridia bacterium]
MKEVLNLKYIMLILVVALMIVFTNKVEASTGTVTTETLNLRSEASTNSSVIELLNANEKLDIISEDGNWYKVEHNGKEGYVSKEYVELNSEDTTNKPEQSENTNLSNVTNQSANIEVNTAIKLEKDTVIKILPLINSNNLGNVKAGEEITVIAKANNWIFVQTADIAGWIINVNETIKDTDTEKATNIEDEDKKEPEQTGNDKKEDKQNETNYEQSVTKYVNASSVYLRREPSTDATIVTTLIKNTDVKVTGEVEDWYKVKFNDYSGYIHKELLSDSKVEATNRGTSNREKAISNVSNNKVSELGSEIVSYAKQYLGCPYVYGAAGSQSFDCSGFTMYVYKHFGYSLSHSATAQSKVGTYVAKEDLQPGDLVFFLDYETMDGIGHCGIYIGDGEFIHASSGSGYCVKTSTLLSGSYYNRYATARRLI